MRMEDRCKWFRHQPCSGGQLSRYAVYADTGPSPMTVALWHEVKSSGVRWLSALLQHCLQHGTWTLDRRFLSTGSMSGRMRACAFDSLAGTLQRLIELGPLGIIIPTKPIGDQTSKRKD
ncbi:uncharacterized protein MYCFIDRAFT_171889 [Pseudocercospora fijiensis CIRAD86]|uniref:Uncharacterized protein n=1 Tax=Pseudocercospora fijiensis (strain CIRAD86) TaxID=383855 RepID=M3BA01_PSEFD|nr:uncharacterized protein MYCFIDRAFT_171889 [Pseudocercospora fijiensis CIRAD86]EME86083.1 hypothetical protein MYCFIDRAFT_171889 [Pseudocercospora fijiensis CIRAD86]